MKYKEGHSPRQFEPNKNVFEMQEEQVVIVLSQVAHGEVQAAHLLPTKIEPAEHLSVQAFSTVKIFPVEQVRHPL